MKYPLATTTWSDEEIAASNALMVAGTLTMGKEVKAFEEQFAEYIGTKYAVMFNSGSSANLALLAAMRYFKGKKISAGDHVIVPTVSWSTTYYPVNQAGFVLDFVDINPITLNINVDAIEKVITPKTKAIFAVNLLGNPCDMEKLIELCEKYDLYLIEDNCESLGAQLNGQRTGSFGLAGTHSFFFSHHICTMEGGMVSTNSLELAETLISIRAHGWTRGLSAENSVHPKSNNDWDDLFRFVLPGYNLRPLEISGAIGQIQLRKFPEFLKWRRINAAHFESLFNDSSSYQIQSENGESSWFGFSLILKGKLAGKRGDVIALLTENGVDSRPIVAGNFTINPVMKHLEYGALPSTQSADEIHQNGFFIGNHHSDHREEISAIHDLLLRYEASVK